MGAPALAAAFVASAWVALAPAPWVPPHAAQRTALALFPWLLALGWPRRRRAQGAVLLPLALLLPTLAAALRLDLAAARTARELAWTVGGAALCAAWLAAAAQRSSATQRGRDVYTLLWTSSVVAAPALALCAGLAGEVPPALDLCARVSPLDWLHGRAAGGAGGPASLVRAVGASALLFALVEVALRVGGTEEGT